jgi:DNA-binding NtrC family response regulator
VTESPGTSVRRVLIIDDEPAIRLALARLLAKAGYDVVRAESASAAHRALDAIRFDALIIDYLLPDLRGDVCYAYAIAAQPHLRRHAIFITGDISESIHEAIDETGCACLLKPFENAKLLDAVHRAVHHSPDMQPENRTRRGD